MYFTFPCPQCGKKLKVREEASGKKAGCPYCKASLVVPTPPPPEDDLAAALKGIGEKAPAGPSVATSASRGKAKPPARRKKASKGGAERTDVGLLASGLLGLVIAAVFMAAMFPVRDIYFGELFWARGWVPPVEVFLMSWSVAILLLKWGKLKKQRNSMLFDLLPNDIADDITEENVDKFIRHVHDLPVDPSESFLVGRVARGLEHFRIRKSNPEAAAMLASHSDIDANSVESSYTILNVFIWAIPILGFIGTVIGISAAVGGFSGAMDQASDLSALKDSLNGVTGGLATAFDTTLVALVMSLLVMFPTSSMQKSEEDLLNWVDEYCNENLLKRLNDGYGTGPDRESGGVNQFAVRRAVDAAMAQHHAELKAWTEKLESIGGTLTDEAVKGWEKIHETIRERQEENVEEVEDLEITLGAFQEALTDLAAQTGEMQERIAGSMDRSAESLAGYCTALERGLAGLSDVLVRLGEQQVVIQAPERRRGWFFRRNNQPK